MNKVKNIAWIALGIALVGFFIYKVARRSLTDHLLQDNAQKAKAVIIDEKNSMGNQPVKPKFSYSYQFEVNGEKYTGNAHDTTLKIGDSVEIQYDKEHPSINKPLHSRE